LYRMKWGLLFLFFIVRLYVGFVSADNFCYNTPTCMSNYTSMFTTCAGRYCGRPYSNGQITSQQCQACPRGTKTDHYACLPCTDYLSSYAIMYIAFMVGSVLLCHFSFIDWTTRLFPNKVKLFASAIVECLISIFATVGAFQPVGSFQLYSCGSSQLSDWYPIFYNPTTMACGSEVVYPLFTLVLLFYGFSVALTMLLRVPICFRYCEQDGKTSIYCSLYLFPVLTVLHVIMSGLIYYSFPYIILVSSLALTIFYFLYFRNNLLSNWYIITQLVLFYLSSVFAIMSLLLFFQSSWYVTFAAVIVPAVPPAICLVLSKPLQKFTKSFQLRSQ